MSEKIVSMKFGGTSVATAERREMIVQHVRREISAGYHPALVVSAMGRRGDPYATDTLLDLMRNMGGTVDPRNYSFLFVTGEIISAGVMAHTLKLAGLDTVSLTGGQAGVITEDFYMSAGVAKLDNTRLKKIVSQGKIPVVTGGQGMTQTDGDSSILGRGGSDTSGVLVGVMLDAERADIYTDVEYMLAMDPRVVPGASKREEISFEAAYEMARFGSKVIHPRAVKVGMEHHLPVRVRSTFSQNVGTLISAKLDKTALVGFSMIGNASIGEAGAHQLKRDELDTLEQHIGLLTLTESASGKQVFCVPAGDTLSEVDSELALHGVTNVNWQTGVSLVTLVGTPEAMPEIDKKAVQTLTEQQLPVIYHDKQARRSTFVVHETESRKALETLYHAVSAYL
jgi:aspartate kinase